MCEEKVSQFWERRAGDVQVESMLVLEKGSWDMLGKREPVLEKGS